jgi:hypothetical protein
MIFFSSVSSEILMSAHPLKRSYATLLYPMSSRRAYWPSWWYSASALRLSVVLAPSLINTPTRRMTSLPMMQTKNGKV